MTPVWNTSAGHAPLGTVLIVDDDEGTRASYAWMLRSGGYAVITAADAEEGLREADRRQPDAILLDLRMPRIDGLEFLKRLRARDAHRETPVAFVTGDYLLDDSIAGNLQSLGAGLQLKPLWLEELLALVQRLLTLRPATTSLDTRRRQARRSR